MLTLFFYPTSSDCNWSRSYSFLSFFLNFSVRLPVVHASVFFWDLMMSITFSYRKRWKLLYGTDFWESRLERHSSGKRWAISFSIAFHKFFVLESSSYYRYPGYLKMLQPTVCGLGWPLSPTEEWDFCFNLFSHHFGFDYVYAVHI